MDKLSYSLHIKGWVYKLFIKYNPSKYIKQMVYNWLGTENEFRIQLNKPESECIYCNNKYVSILDTTYVCDNCNNKWQIVSGCKVCSKILTNTELVLVYKEDVIFKRAHCYGCNSIYDGKEYEDTVSKVVKRVIL